MCFLVSSQVSPQPAPFVDFNISHHGDWVAIAVERGRLVGLDVTTMEAPRRTSSLLCGVPGGHKSHRRVMSQQARVWSGFWTASPHNSLAMSFVAFTRPHPSQRMCSRPVLPGQGLSLSLAKVCMSGVVRRWLQKVSCSYLGCATDVAVDSRLAMFFWHWACKEAYVKVRSARVCVRACGARACRSLHSPCRRPEASALASIFSVLTFPFDQLRRGCLRYSECAKLVRSSRLEGDLLSPVLFRVVDGCRGRDRSLSMWMEHATRSGWWHERSGGVVCS